LHRRAVPFGEVSGFGRATRTFLLRKIHRALPKAQNSPACLLRLGIPTAQYRHSRMDGLGKPRECLVPVIWGLEPRVRFEGGSVRRLRRESSRPPHSFLAHQYSDIIVSLASAMAAGFMPTRVFAFHGIAKALYLSLARFRTELPSVSSAATLHTFPGTAL